MEPKARKDSIRRLALMRRGRLPDAERTARAAALVERVLGLPEVAEANTALAFVSIRTEVPTEMLLQALLTGGKRLLLPYVSDDGALRASRVASLGELSPGYRGIPEPRARLPVDPAAADVVIVPGVAFDAAGGRLGYGGGFYDRFLRAAPRVPRVGICFEAQIVDEVPVEKHDERVDVVVTEERVLRRAS